jgi:hypothetical protein
VAFLSLRIKRVVLLLKIYPWPSLRDSGCHHSSIRIFSFRRKVVAGKSLSGFNAVAAAGNRDHLPLARSTFTYLLAQKIVFCNPDLDKSTAVCKVGDLEYTLPKVHAYEVYTHEVHAYEVHAHEVYACEMHAPESRL